MHRRPHPFLTGQINITMTINASFPINTTCKLSLLVLLLMATSISWASNEESGKGNSGNNDNGNNNSVISKTIRANPDDIKTESVGSNDGGPPRGNPAASKHRKSRNRGVDILIAVVFLYFTYKLFMVVKNIFVAKANNTPSPSTDISMPPPKNTTTTPSKAPPQTKPNNNPYPTGIIFICLLIFLACLLGLAVFLVKRRK